jgi:hypothetical protein
MVQGLDGEMVIVLSGTLLMQPLALSTHYVIGQLALSALVKKFYQPPEEMVVEPIEELQVSALLPKFGETFANVLTHLLDCLTLNVSVMVCPLEHDTQTFSSYP